LVDRDKNSMNVRDLQWSKAEKQTARKASEPRDLWRIHDYLTEQRDRTDEKYDYRYSVLPFVFARLLKEGWLAEADLEGLGADKREIIRFLAGS
jgi:hypothetical protein